MVSIETLLSDEHTMDMQRNRISDIQHCIIVGRHIQLLLQDQDHKRSLSDMAKNVE